MDYMPIQDGNILAVQSSSALVRKVEQNYRDMINAKLLNSLERMQHPTYQSKAIDDDFFEAVLERVKSQRI